MSTLEIDLRRVAQLAAARRDEFEVLRYTLELDDDIDDVRLDALVEQLAAPIMAAIDCTQCANCCSKLGVDVTREDVVRLALALKIPLENFIARYVNGDSEDDWTLRAQPCPFLKAKLCSVYAHRPEACRIYPAFTPDFRWVIADLIASAAYCPIAYNVLSELSGQFDRLYPQMIKNS